MTLRACAASSADAIWSAMRDGAPDRERPLVRDLLGQRVALEVLEHQVGDVPGSSPKSVDATMLGCPKVPTARASLRNRATTSGSPAISRCRTLMATVRPIFTCIAS